MRTSLALAAGLLWALLSTPSARAHDDDIELFLANTGVDLDARSRACPRSRDSARKKFKVREEFRSTGADPDAEGRAKLRVKRGRRRFQVKAKDLPPGSYDLVVGGTRVAGIQLAPEDDEPDEIEG